MLVGLHVLVASAVLGHPLALALKVAAALVLVVGKWEVQQVLSSLV